MPRKWQIAGAILIVLPIILTAGCSQQENPSQSSGTAPLTVTASGSPSASQAVTEPVARATDSVATTSPAEPRLLEARVYRGTVAVPPNHLVTFSEPAHLALIAEALLHKDRLSGMFSVRTPDYALVLDYGAEQQQVDLWLHYSSGGLMNRKPSSALYQITDGFDQKLRSLIAEFEPISVFQGSSQIAVNQVTEKEKQALVRELLSAVSKQSAPWYNGPFDLSYRFVIDGSTYSLRIADDTYTLINESATQYRLQKNEGISLTEALGVNLLEDFGIPLGNQHVQRYCGYIYYTMNGRLFRMRENGTGVELLLAKSESASRLIGQGGSLYFFSGAPDSTVYQVQTDSRVAPLVPIATRVGNVLAITDKHVYYLTAEQPGQPVVTRRLSIQGKGDILIRKEKAEAAVVYAVSASEDLLYLTVSVGERPGSHPASVKLEKCLPDGRLVAAIDEGWIDQLALCGDFLVYRKTVSPNLAQIWAFDTDRATLKLLADSADAGTGTADMDAIFLNIVGVDDSESSLNYATSKNGAGSDLYSIMPGTLKRRDLAGPKELVWNGMQTRKSLLGVDLVGDWLYYAILPANPAAGGSPAADAEANARVLSSHRCRLDGTSDLNFSDGADSIAVAAGDPLTIGRWIYFIAGQEVNKPQRLLRFNTETGMKESLSNGLVHS